MNNQELLRSYGRELVKEKIKQLSNPDILEIKQELIEQIYKDPLSELMYTKEEMEEIKRGIEEGVGEYL